jgi:hypothetical protein
MILYHSTWAELLPSIASRGLLPHVPGEHPHYGPDIGNPALASMTMGRAVVWLTSNPKEWQEPRLSIRLEPNSKFLTHYWSWRMRQPDAHIVRCTIDSAQLDNVQNWFVHFGTINPGRIIAGLTRG